jgi:hypothetical protein
MEKGRRLRREQYEAITAMRERLFDMYGADSGSTGSHADGGVFRELERAKYDLQRKSA